VIRDPVPGNLDAPTEPHPVAPFDVIEKSREGSEPSREHVGDDPAAFFPAHYAGRVREYCHS